MANSQPRATHGSHCAASLLDAVEADALTILRAAPNESPSVPNQRFGTLKKGGVPESRRPNSRPILPPLPPWGAQKLATNFGLGTLVVRSFSGHAAARHGR